MEEDGAWSDMMDYYLVVVVGGLAGFKSYSVGMVLEWEYHRLRSNNTSYHDVCHGCFPILDFGF